MFIHDTVRIQFDYRDLFSLAPIVLADESTEMIEPIERAATDTQQEYGAGSNDYENDELDYNFGEASEDPECNFSV